MNTRQWSLVVGLSLALIAASSRDLLGADDAPDLSPQKQIELMKDVDPSLVRVEYELQFDKGEAPYGSGWAIRCPSCGQYHNENIDTLVPEERPARLAGFLVAPDLVITTDFMIHPRFLKKIGVGNGGELIQAETMAVYVRQNATLLKLAKPLPNAKPLEFDSKTPGPYEGIVRVNTNATWLTSVKPLEMSLTELASGYRFFAAPSQCLIVPATPGGKPVALSMNEELDPEGKWKISPLEWEKIETADMEQRLATLQKQADRGIVRVQLTLRSPRPTAGGPSARFMSSRTDGDQATERQALAVITDPTHLLILDQLKPSVTARLEGITAYLPDGTTATAKFAGSLKDYGALIATLDSPVEGAIAFSDQDLLLHRNTLLLEAEIKLQGETRIAYMSRRRTAGFRIGWREQVYPVYPATAKPRFVFDLSGKLVSLPISRRDKVTAAEPISRPPTTEDTGAKYVLAILSKPEKYLDPANVPLNSAQESRLAWMGMELQSLTPDLARANNVSQFTRDGQTGALVTYVYPGSPGADAGIAAGAVLLRLHVPGQPRPVEIRGERFPYAEQPFPWDRFDELPEQYFDQITRPWPSAETELARALTDIGFGNNCELEYAVGGKSQRQTFQVQQSPPHFDTAARFKSDRMGITVREMTYEVRRYFQRKTDEPGVIISKIEPGSRASKAGLKPYEFITHVNDQSINTPGDFERLTRAGGDLQLSVRRNTRGRVVKVTLDPDAAPAPADQ